MTAMSQRMFLYRVCRCIQLTAVYTLSWETISSFVDDQTSSKHFIDAFWRGLGQTGPLKAQETGETFRPTGPPKRKM